MKVKDFIKRLTELSSMAKGEDTEVFFAMPSPEEPDGQALVTCRPEYVEVVESSVDYHHFRLANNDDVRVTKAILIDRLSW